MKTPYEILNSTMRVTNTLHDMHIVRKYAFERTGEQLGRALLHKAFEQPIIIRALWKDVEDYRKMYTDIIGCVRWMPFKDWAVENLRAGDAEFGSVLSIPLTNERMAVQRDLGIFYTK